MKKIVLFGLFIALTVGPARAAEDLPSPPEPAVYASVTTTTGYVWRGQILDDRAVVQPYLQVTHHGFLVSVWANLNTSEKNMADRDFTEVDLTASYALPVEAAELALGVIYYLPVSTDLERYHEVFITAKYPNSWVVPRVEAYQSFDGNHGYYLLAGLSRDFELTGVLTLSGDFSSGFGSSRFNEYCYGVEGNRMNDGSVSISAGYAISATVSLTPSIRYTWLWDSKLRDASAEVFPASGSDPHLFTASLTLDYSF